MLVFSDSHGRTLDMVRAVRQQQPDAVFHLGDCERDAQRLTKEFPELPLYCVCGNCDHEPVQPEVRQLTLDGVKFFLTHGHRYGVKYTLDALLNAAYFAGADMALFGHTHRAVSETIQGLYVVNPGTAGVGTVRTYACIETDGGAIRTVGIHALPEA